MATYTIVETKADGSQVSSLSDLPGDAVVTDLWASLSEEVISLSVGRGADPDTVEWLGVWDWNSGDPCWTPAE